MAQLPDSTLTRLRNTTTQILRALFLAWSFLLPKRERPAEDDRQWRHASNGFMVCGLLLGIVYAGVFRATWRWFGEYQYIRFIPVAILLVVDFGWGGYRPFQSFIRLFGGKPPREREEPIGQTLAVVLLVLLKYALMLSLPPGDSEWASWRARLGVLYPKAIYRPLLLMVLWGRWGSWLALCIGRPHPSASPRLIEMARGVRLPAVITTCLALVCLTLFYASGSAADFSRGTIIALGTLVSAYLVSFYFARRERGQTEDTVLATSLLVEFAFLGLYLPVVSNIFRY